MLVSDPSSTNNLEEAKVLASSSVMLVAGIAVGETKKPRHNHPIVGGSPAKIVDKLSQKAEQSDSTTESGKKNFGFKPVSASVDASPINQVLMYIFSSNFPPFYYIFDFFD
ncbi:unnamed protein product [Protopolystoma xenopodis]|uniref:Uncharacterized protein n=1 Tax=Protopolystoma xenopodis TaxID=117903 RepID=A0A3S5B2Y1_9PLAT|nr:unnamed protein product [Protopolystoma xenopodis]